MNTEKSNNWPALNPQPDWMRIDGIKTKIKTKIPLSDDEILVYVRSVTFQDNLDVLSPKFLNELKTGTYTDPRPLTGGKKTSRKSNSKKTSRKTNSKKTSRKSNSKKTSRK